MSSDGTTPDSSAGVENHEDAAPEPLSWRVVSMIYAAGSVACLLFAVLSLVFKVEQIDGFWLIFALFPPCLLYSLYMQYTQKSALKPKGD
jgi:hypothetical protein